MHKDLMTLSSWYPIKYLKPSSVCLNLSDITVLFISTKFKSIGCLDLWNSLLSILISSNFKDIFMLSKIKLIWTIILHFCIGLIADIFLFDTF